ncbi:MAG TPA: hypothetical protein VNQ73_20810 [Ilumatobacter sp.]|nr:hypothetical protein [Ilumatobacter sp.]
MDLLGRLGGAAALAGVTEALYEQLLADPEVGPLFAATHLPEQRHRFAEYLVAACRGNEPTPSQRLHVAHYDQGVTDRHFAIMHGCLTDVLTTAGFDAAATAELLDLIIARRADVVSR